MLLVLALLGPLALRMLWRSRQFNRYWKIGLTVVVVAVTALILRDLWGYANQLAKSLDPALAP